MKVRMQWTFLVMFILCLTPPALQAYPSLFFTEKEIHLMGQALSSQHNVTKKTEGSATLSLSAIIYVDEHHWTLWANNQIIHAKDGRSFDGFHIKRVRPLKVEFSWIPPNATHPIVFTLRPQQMFLGTENRIIPKWGARVPRKKKQ